MYNLTSRICKGPGHFLEVQKILPLLVASSPDHPSYHVVALSLPGYGFSEAPKKKGFAIPQYAEVWTVSMCPLWLYLAVTALRSDINSCSL